MIKASVSISTRELHVYANGYCKVFLRLYIGRKSNYYEIPHVEFLPQNWDKINKKVKNKTPDYADINLQISHFYNLANGILRRYSRENRNITFDSFEMELYNKGYETDFFEYAKKHIAKYDNKSTADKIEDTISKLKQFTKSEILSFGEIDENLLLKFKNWCMTVKNNKDITATRGLGIIRTIFNAAIQDEIITDNPVRKIKLDSFGKQKGGMKVHMLTDVHADCAKFVKMSETRMHDKKFLQYLNCLTAGCMIVFDKAYNFYFQFAKWTEAGIFFVCRLKDNAKYEVVETLYDKPFSTVAALIRMHFISYLDLFWVINNGRRSYRKRTKTRNKSPDAVQISLFT